MATKQPILPCCLGLYDLPKNYTRRGDPLNAEKRDFIDAVLHEQNTAELAAIEKTLWDGGMTNQKALEDNKGDTNES